MIHKCIELFNLLPITPLYKWSIAADWIQEEQNIEITANAIREGIFVLEVIEGVRTFDYENGRGSGNGSGNGSGFKYGNGFGDGKGAGDGFGLGDGCGKGDNSGYGFGTSDGDVNASVV